MVTNLEIRTSPIELTPFNPTPEGIEAKMRNYAAVISDIEKDGELAREEWIQLNPFITTIDEQASPVDMLQVARKLIQESDYVSIVGAAMLSAPNVTESIGNNKPQWLSEGFYEQNLPYWNYWDKFINNFKANKRKFDPQLHPLEEVLQNWDSLINDPNKLHMYLYTLKHTLHMRHLYGKEGKVKDKKALVYWAGVIYNRIGNNYPWFRGLTSTACEYWPDLEGTLVQKYYGLEC